MKPATGLVLAGLSLVACQRTQTDNPDARVGTETPAAVSDTMRIHFERSGGFAGMTVNVDIDADSLPESERRDLASLVSRASFFSLPAQITGSTPSRGADQFSYRISIESGGRRHTVETSDGAAPATLIPLLDWLNGAARRARASGGR